MAYQIITDSSWDLDSEKAAELEVEVIPFFVSKDGEHYLKEKEELPVRDLYQFMAENPGIYPKTAQPSLEEYVERFRRQAELGKDVICCTANRIFTGSYNSAMLARQMVLEDHPDCRIEVIDTMQVTLMQGLIIQEMALYRKTGVSFERTVALGKRICETSRIFFTVSNLDYLIHGGRVGKLAGTAANVLHLCPMIILAGGELESGGVARGRKLARKKALGMLMDYIRACGYGIDHYRFIVGYGYDIEEGDLLLSMMKEEIEAAWPGSHPEVTCDQIGAAVGVHTGPYPLGFGIVERWDRIDEEKSL